MLYEKIIRRQNAGVTAGSVGDLLREFDVDLNDYLIEMLDKFPVDDDYSIVYDTYYDLVFEEYTIFVFKGRVSGVNTSPTYRLLVDLRHAHVYYIGVSSLGSSVYEYDLGGRLISAEDYGLGGVDFDEFVANRLVDYVCNCIGDLVDCFNLDFNLSDKLRMHEIAYPCDVLFNEYFIRECDGVEYYVFQGCLSGGVDCVFAPIYYIDPVGQRLYHQSCGMMGVGVDVFDCDDVAVDSARLDFDDFNSLCIDKILNALMND